MIPGAGENRDIAALISVEFAKRVGELASGGGIDSVAMLRPLDLHHVDVVDLPA